MALDKDFVVKKGLVAKDGDITLDVGNVIVTAGDANVIAGNVNVDAGAVNVTLGDVNVDAGNVNIATLSKGIVFDTGVQITRSDETEITIQVSTGQVVVDSAGLTLGSGNTLTITELAGGGTQFLAVDNGGVITTTTVDINDIVPDQTGNAGKVLTTDGSVVSWETIPAGDVTSAGNNTFTGNNTFNNPVTVATPTADGHAATKLYVDDAVATKQDADVKLDGLSNVGGTGILVLQDNGAGIIATTAILGTSGQITITDGDGVVGQPTIALATAGTPISNGFRKITTDTFGRVTASTAVATGDITALVDSTYVNVAGDTMTGPLNMGAQQITGLAAPTGGTDATNKNYVDALVSGLVWKQAVAAATTANVTLSGEQTIDGVALVTGDRVLVKNQSTAADNGIYVVASGAWTRSTDMDSGSEFSSATVFVKQGTVNADSGWTQTAEVTTVGTDTVTFVQFTGAGTYTAGTGLSLSGNTFNVNLGAGIVELPTDEVGIDLYNVSGNALILTTDGTTRSTANGSQLALLLDGATLAQGTNGLKVNAASITGVELAASVAGNGLTGGAGSALAVGTASSSRIVVNANDIDLATVTNSNTGTFQKLTVDSYGRVTGTTAVVAADVDTLFKTSTTAPNGSPLVIASFPIATYDAAKFVVKAKLSTDYHAIEILAAHNGTTADGTEYAEITSAGTLATFSVAINGANVELTASGHTTGTTFVVHMITL